MKKNILSLAVASSVAGLAVTAQAAMYLNPEGTGEVLLFPYYNAQNGNETSMSIVNTSPDAKALKVRFMEYVNSQEVLDFNLYMSAGDHFSFTIFQVGDGGAIVTRDNSCTVPELGTGSGDFGGTQTDNADGSVTRVQPFVNYAYGVSGTGVTADNYASITRSLAGHVEVIEMGVLDDTTPGSTTAFNPESWATHGSDGVPANCAGLVSAWSTTAGVKGAWLDDKTDEIESPSGGLYGVANMLNNSDSAAYGMEAAAIADFWGKAGDPLVKISGHEKPGDAFPSLAQGDTSSIIPNNGAVYTNAFAKGIDAVSSLFMAQSISNDVMANPVLAGETDWVVTFPTRRYYVNTNPAALPFTDPYIGSGTAGGPETSCETVGIVQTDREESTTDAGSTGPAFSPAPPNQPGVTGPQLCYETNTIAINGVSALNASVSTDTVADVAKTLSWGEDQPEGWQTITFGAGNYIDSTDGDAAKRRIQGLPVMGFAAFEYTNATSNFGFVSDHKTSIAGSGINP